MTYVFSWRDYAIVKTPEGFWRVNSVEQHYNTIESAIERIESEIDEYERGSLKWHRDKNTDLWCVVHNCLYWQCECGKKTWAPASHDKLVNFMTTNIGAMIQDHHMSKVDESGTPFGVADRPMQIANCEPMSVGPNGIRNLIVELWNGTKFHIRIEVVE